MSEEFQVNIVTDLCSLHELKDDWKQISHLSPNLFLQYDWILSCAESFYDEKMLRIFVVRRETKIEAIAPLVLIKKGFSVWLQIIGVSILYEPTDFLYKNSDALRVLLQAILKYGAPILLERTHGSSDIWSGFVAMRKQTMFQVKQQTANSCYLSLEGNWDEFTKKMTQSRRTDFRRLRRRSEELGNVEFKTITPDNDNLKGPLLTAFNIESSGWKGKQGTAVLNKLGMYDFFKNYTERVCGQGKLRLFFMCIDNEPIAMHLAVEHADRLWILKIGYREEWSKLSPGLQVCLETIRYALKNNLSFYEFLGVEERWQYAWPVSSNSYYVILAFPYSLQGLSGLIQTLTSVIKKRIISIVKTTGKS